MTHLQTQLQVRADEAVLSLRQAWVTGDDYLAEVRVGELEELDRIARAHDLILTGVDQVLKGDLAVG